MKRVAAYFISILSLCCAQTSFADDFDGSYPSNDYSSQSANYAPDANDSYSNAFPEPSQENYREESYPDDEYHEENYYHHPRYRDADNSSEVEEYEEPTHHKGHYAVSLPVQIGNQGEPVIIVNPRVHAWGAYTADGKLLHSGLATAGSSWCEDLGKPCRTKTGTFRIRSLGDADCYSRKFPLGEGGAPMPYCMYFNGGQGIHGSHELAYANLSHGCVRVSVEDARWLRFNFTHINTKVIIEPY